MEIDAVSTPRNPLRIRELSSEERPRERLAAHGSGALSDAELLAILLRTGVRGRNAVELARNLLHKYGSLQTLSRTSVAELTREHGLGQAKAVTLSAAFGLGQRLAREKMRKVKIDAPEIVYDLLGAEMRSLSREVLRVLVLNTRYELVQMVDISQGSVNESIAHPRDILAPVFAYSAYAFILVHNHPSGDPSPSQADMRLTRRLNEAAGMLQVSMLDHVVIGSPDNDRIPYYSFKEAGLL